MSGVFAVDRGVFDHPIFAPEPFTEREAWLWMIGAAAWKKTRARCGRATVELDRGQLAFSLRFMARKWRWTSEARVRRFLKRLEIDAMVTVSATHETTHITICNYDKFAFGRRTDDAEIDALTDAQPTHSRRKEEEVNKDKKEEEKVSAALRADAQPDAPKKVSQETKSKRAKARIPIPDDWKPGERGIAYAIERGFVDAQTEPIARNFVNFHKAKGSLMADWSAAWRTWVDNEIKFNAGKYNGYRGQRPLHDDSRSAGQAAGRLAEQARAGQFTFGPRPSLVPGASENPVRLLSKG